jgi:hypothetical protein
MKFLGKATLPGSTPAAPNQPVRLKVEKSRSSAAVLALFWALAYREAIPWTPAIV